MDLTIGNGLKSSLGAFALRYSFFLRFFSLCAFLFSFDPVSLHGLGFYVFLRSVL